MADRDPSSPTDPSDPAQRGSLSVADKVIEKVATAAAREIDEVTDQQSGWRTVTRRSLPRATATIAGGHSRIGVEIATPWPTPLTAVATRTRDHVRERVTTLTGMDVIAVDVTVAEVVHVETENRRVR